MHALICIDGISPYTFACLASQICICMRLIERKMITQKSSIHGSIRFHAYTYIPLQFNQWNECVMSLDASWSGCLKCKIKYNGHIECIGKVVVDQLFLLLCMSYCCTRARRRRRRRRGSQNEMESKRKILSSCLHLCAMGGYNVHVNRWTTHRAWCR